MQQRTGEDTTLKGGNGYAEAALQAPTVPLLDSCQTGLEGWTKREIKACLHASDDVTVTAHIPRRFPVLTLDTPLAQTYTSLLSVSLGTAIRLAP